MRRYQWLQALIVSSALAGCAGPPMRPVEVLPAIAGEANTIDVSSARPVAAVALDMPDMRMPLKRYALRPSGAGRYEASNLDFPMAGTWRVSVLDASGKRVSSFTVSIR